MSDVLTWRLDPVCAPHPATRWEFRLEYESSRVIEGFGVARSMRRARKKLRRAIKRAETGRP